MAPARDLTLPGAVGESFLGCRNKGALLPFLPFLARRTSYVAAETAGRKVGVCDGDDDSGRWDGHGGLWRKIGGLLDELVHSVRSRNFIITWSRI